MSSSEGAKKSKSGFSCARGMTRLSTSDQHEFAARWRALSQELGKDLRDDSRLAFEYCKGYLPACWTPAWVADEIRANKHRQASALYLATVQLCIVHLHDWLVMQASPSPRHAAYMTPAASAETAAQNAKLAKRYGTALARCFYASKIHPRDVVAEMHERFALCYEDASSAAYQPYQSYQLYQPNQPCAPQLQTTSVTAPSSPFYFEYAEEEAAE